MRILDKMARKQAKGKRIIDYHPCSGHDAREKIAFEPALSENIFAFLALFFSFVSVILFPFPHRICM